MDYRRYRAAKEGAAFGRCCPSVLLPAWQRGQLPGRGVAVYSQRTCEPASGLSPVPAARMDERWRTSMHAAYRPRHGAIGIYWLRVQRLQYRQQILVRHHPGVVTNECEFAAQVMCADAGFHAD